MNLLIADTIYPITLVGGAKTLPEVVNHVLTYAPNLFAADGGAKTAVDLGHVPEAVIGDFDSIDDATIAQIPEQRLHRVSEQDSTDFEKCLRLISAPLILAVGFTGGRLDHELAVYNALLRYADKPCVVVGDVDLCFVAPLSMQLSLPENTRVGLFAFQECTVTAKGLRWPLDQATLAPDGLMSCSNEISVGELSLQVSSQKLLVILPRACLGAVVQALLPT